MTVTSAEANLSGLQARGIIAMQLHRRLLWIPALATLTYLLYFQLCPELPKMPISGYLHRPRRKVVEFKSSRGFGQRLVKYLNFTYPVEYKGIIVHRPRREVVEYKSSRGFGQRLVKYLNLTYPVEYKDIIVHRPRREVVEYKSSRGFGQRLVKYLNFTFPVEYKDIIVNMNAYLRKPPEARENDVWLINYPKSGTHFLWEIVSMLVRNALEMNPMEKERAMCPELVLPDHVDNMASPRVLNTHVPPRFFSTEARNVSKFLYLIRNPKDVFVSYYFHRKNLSGFKGAFEDFLELVYRGHAGYGRWIDHVKDWLAVMKDKPNFLIVKYEKLVKEPVSEIRRIAQFIGFERDESFYQNLATKCSFANMKKHKVRKRQKYKLFYRNGTVGNWKNFFTTEQNLEFEKRLGEELKYLPFALDFE